MSAAFVIEPTQGLMDRFIVFLMRKCTNSHAKRILILTSLYCRLLKIDQLKEEAIDKLNLLLELAFRRDALRLPAVMQHLLWNDSKFDQKVQSYFKDKEFTTEFELDELINSLYNAVPKDFRYSNKESMLNDLRTLVHDVTKEDHFIECYSAA